MSLSVLNLVVSIHEPALISPDPVFPDESWLASERGRGLCVTCACVDRTKYPQPLDVRLATPPDDQVCAPVETTGVMIFRRDLLEGLEEDLRGFALGQCFVVDGQELGAYASCYSPSYVVLRGSPQSRYAVCPDCGTILSELGNSPKYVLERALSEALVYQDGRCQLLIADEVLSRLDRDEWLDFYPEGVIVQQFAVDGQRLPGDP